LKQNHKTAIIIGASSGIGKALCAQYSKSDWRILACGRRISLLEEIQQSNPSVSPYQLDIREPEDIKSFFNTVFLDFPSIDLVIINSGVGYKNPGYDDFKNVIDTNVNGFAVCAFYALEHLTKQGHGHIAGISSVGGIRGLRVGSVYSASKSFDSILLEGFRHHCVKNNLNIRITDIRPGFIRTDFIKERPNALWAISPEKAAQKIFRAIKKNKAMAYIPGRWRFIAFLMRIMPSWLYYKI
jgi:short-subunit dehydrogenase